MVNVMNKVVLYKGGQTLAYTEFGHPHGFPVLIQHGMIASIRDRHLFQQLVDAGARLVSIARPGYGESSPYRMENIAEWGEIISVLADELGLAQFDVLGISSGAPYSYAIGYQLSDRVRNLFILSGTPALYDDKVRAFWPYPLTPEASIPELQKLAYELFFAHLSAEDRARDEVRDSMRNDCFGIALDLKLRCNDWGFQLAEVRGRVTMRHSRADNAVPLAAAEMTARLLPDCRLEIRENAPHFSQAVLDDFIRTAMARFYKK